MENVKQKAREMFDERFPDNEWRDKLGDYADHAPAYTHPDGECTCCPQQYWNIDDLFPQIKDHIDQIIDLAIAERDKNIVEMIEEKTLASYPKSKNQEEHEYNMVIVDNTVAEVRETLIDLITNSKK